jgi:hypothetical protein
MWRAPSDGGAGGGYRLRQAVQGLSEGSTGFVGQGLEMPGTELGGLSLSAGSFEQPGDDAHVKAAEDFGVGGGRSTERAVICNHAFPALIGGDGEADAGKRSGYRVQRFRESRLVRHAHGCRQLEAVAPSGFLGGLRRPFRGQALHHFCKQHGQQVLAKVGVGHRYSLLGGEVGLCRASGACTADPRTGPSANSQVAVLDQALEVMTGDIGVDSEEVGDAPGSYRLGRITGGHEDAAPSGIPQGGGEITESLLEAGCRHRLGG